MKINKELIGKRLRLIEVKETPSIVELQTEGTVYNVDNHGVIHVNWDNGYRFGLLPESDKFELIEDIGSSKYKQTQNLKSTSKSLGIPKSTTTRQINTDFKSKVKQSGIGSKDIKFEDTIKGGLADDMTVSDLAKKHGVSKKAIERELKIGVGVEREHTSSDKKAREISKDHVAEFPDAYTNPKHGIKASEKGLEKIHSDIEETTTGSAGGYSAPLGVLRKKVYKVGQLKEVTMTHDTDMEEGDLNSWADKNKDGWKWNDKTIWKNGEIVDVLAKIKTNWNDGSMDITKDLNKTENLIITKETILENIDNPKKKNNKKSEVISSIDELIKLHTEKLELLKKHKQGLLQKLDKDSEIDEVTTTSAVYGPDGRNTINTPMFVAKGKSRYSKKPIWKGGKIIQETDDVLENTSKPFTTKVKIKDKCKKFPYCDQSPEAITLSEKTKKCIKEVAKKLNKSEKTITEIVVNKLRR